MLWKRSRPRDSPFKSEVGLDDLLIYTATALDFEGRHSQAHAVRVEVLKYWRDQAKPVAKINRGSLEREADEWDLESLGSSEARDEDSVVTRPGTPNSDVNMDEDSNGGQDPAHTLPVLQQ
jgi:hypothetical protein